MKYIQYSTATSGTITAVDTADSIQIIQEAGLAVTLTLAFPPNPVDGQIVNFASVGGVTTLSLNASIGTIMNSLTTLAAGGRFAYIYRVVTNKWYLI